jgi:hypothetical protein
MFSFVLSFLTEKRNISDVRQALYDALQLLEEELAQSSGQYLEKDKNQPGLGDLSVYGVLRGLEGLPIHEEIMNRYVKIPLWYQQMRQTVEL